MAIQYSTSSRQAADFDRRNADWYFDKLVQVLVFIGGISAVVFIIGIFVFITKEGFGFLVGEFNFKEFFFSPNWRPTSETKETFGILALIAGTASVTGLAEASVIQNTVITNVSSTSTTVTASIRASTLGGDGPLRGGFGSTT